MKRLLLRTLCANTYFPRRVRIRSPRTRAHYRYALNDFERHLGRPATTRDLDDDIIAVWVNAMLDAGGGAETSRSKAKRILALWRFLAARRLVEHWPTLTLPECPEPTPTALSERELRLLFQAAARKPGTIAGIREADWWPALLGFVLCTSERRGATLACRWEWIDFPSRTVIIPAEHRKGKRKAGIYRLWPELILLLQKIAEPPRDLVFPWELCETMYFYHYGLILEDAGLPNDAKHKTQCLRVTHNTWVKVLTGQHSPLLRHGDAATSERFYEDKRMTAKEVPKLFIPWQP